MIENARAMRRTIASLFRRRIHFKKKYIGKVLTMNDGEKFTAFRHVFLDSLVDVQNKSMAVFVVRFKFPKFSSKTNRRLSWIPVPPIVGQPGFRDKIWTINGTTGFWQGIYQWESAETAEIYIKSFPFELMLKRSIPDSISYEVFQDTLLSDFIRNREE